MPKHKKTGGYEHFSVLIFAQGTWNDKDRESIRKPLLEKYMEKSDNPYPFFTKLTRRKNPPEFGDCPLCHRLYEMFKEIVGPNDFTLYQGHHYLIMEDDLQDMKLLPDIILSKDKVKKFYLLYIEGFSDMKTTDIRAMELNDLKGKLTFKKLKKQDFIEILDNNKFENRTVYEISKY